MINAGCWRGRQQQQAVDDNLIGQLRVTVGTPAKHDHIPNRIGSAPMDADEYATNIQIADLNALNALMAVVK